MARMLAILVLVEALSLAQVDGTKTKLVNLVDEIYIKCPADVTLEKNFPVEDFLLADFSADGAYFLRAYVGNAPKFPSSSCEGVVEERITNGSRMKKIKCTGEDWSSDILLKTELDWPRYVHFMVRGESSDHESIGMIIVNSIQVR